MDGIALEPLRVAVAIEVFVMLERDDGQELAVREVQLLDALHAARRMRLDERELPVIETARLVEDFLRDIHFADVMKERAERELHDVVLVHIEERREDARQHGDIDAVRERVHIMRAQVRQLHEILAPQRHIIDDRGRRRAQRADVERAFFPHVLEHMIDVLDRHGARFFRQHALRRRDAGILRIHGKDMDARDAEPLQFFDIGLRELRALRQVAPAAFIVDALRRHHARLDLAQWQIDHTTSLISTSKALFEQSETTYLKRWTAFGVRRSSSSSARCSKWNRPSPRKTPVHARRGASSLCTLSAHAAILFSPRHRGGSSARRARADSRASQ